MRRPRKPRRPPIPPMKVIPNKKRKDQRKRRAVTLPPE